MWPSHSKGASASDTEMVRLCSSGSKSVTVVPSSTRPMPGRHPGDVQQRLGDGRLAGAAVPDERHVADHRRRNRVHRGTPAGRSRTPDRIGGTDGDPRAERPLVPSEEFGRPRASPRRGAEPPTVPRRLGGPPTCSTGDGARRLEQALEPGRAGPPHASASPPTGSPSSGSSPRPAPRLLIANGNLVLAVFGLILTGLPDVLDGSVARQSGTAGRRGAFFDSVCDRVADALLLGGVAWHSTGGDGELADPRPRRARRRRCSISYERAKAESLGLDARGGVMERAERLVLLGVGLAFDVLVPVLWIMLALTRPHRRPPLRDGVAPGDDRGADTVGCDPANAARTGFAASVAGAPRHVAAYLGYRAAAEVARVVPPALAGPLGPVRLSGVRVANPARRHQVARNLDRVAGRPARPGDASPRRARHVRVYGRYWHELFLLAAVGPRAAPRRARLPRPRPPRRRRRCRPGRRVGLPHLGNWDVAGAWLARQGYGVTVVTEPVEPPELFDWFVGTRERPRDARRRARPHRGARGAPRPARAGRVVALLSDRDITGDGVPVEFFGEADHPAWRSGAARAAQRRATAACRQLLRRRRRPSGARSSAAPATGRRARMRDDVTRVTQLLADQHSRR